MTKSFVFVSKSASPKSRTWPNCTIQTIIISCYTILQFCKDTKDNDRHTANKSSTIRIVVGTSPMAKSY